MNFFLLNLKYRVANATIALKRKGSHANSSWDQGRLHWRRNGQDEFWKINRNHPRRTERSSFQGKKTAPQHTGGTEKGSKCSYKVREIPREAFIIQVTWNLTCMEEERSLLKNINWGRVVWAGFYFRIDQKIFLEILSRLDQGGEK